MGLIERTGNMKKIEYLRKSQFDRDFQDLSVEETLKRHRKQLAEFCERQKIHVDVILEEVVSGESLSQRPQMQKLLELVNTGEYDGIVCMDLDRLSRGSGFDSGYITQVLQVNGCKIITPDKTYDLNDQADEQFSDMKFMFSRYELKTITKRLVNGRKQSVGEGKFIGSTPPYGYEKIKLKGEKGYALKPLPKEAEVVKMIFDLYVNHNLGYKNVAHKLNELGIEARTENGWTQHSIYHVISNPVYIGLTRWGANPVKKTIIEGRLKKKRYHTKGYQTFDGRHEALISEDVFEKAIEIRNRKTHPSVAKRNPIQNPFASLIKCAGCKKTIRYGSTHHYKCENKECDCRSTPANQIEPLIVEKMTEYLHQYKINIENEPETVKLDGTLDAYRKELEELEAQQDKLCDLLEQGVYTTQMFTSRNQKLTERIKNLQEAIKSLTSELEKDDQGVNLIPTTEALLESYDTLTGAEKNQVWLQILDHIDYYRKRGTDDIEIILYPRF